jgi:hypothetical protein
MVFDGHAFTPPHRFPQPQQLVINRPQFLVRSRLLLLHLCYAAVYKYASGLSSSVPFPSTRSEIPLFVSRLCSVSSQARRALSSLGPSFAANAIHYSSDLAVFTFQFCNPRLDHRHSAMYACPLPTVSPFYQTSASPSNGMRGARPEACGQRLATTRVFTIAQRVDYGDSRLIRTLGMAKTMKNDPHSGAAELHQTRRPTRGDDAAHHVRKIT